MATLIYDEIELFGVCLRLGVFLAFCYDCIRIFRMLFIHKNWVIDLEDLVFWLLTAWITFGTLFIYNRGALRGYAFLGMFLGVLIYALTLSRLLLFLARKFLPCWKKAKAIIRKPFAVMVRFIRKTLKNVVAEVKMAVKSR